MTGVEYLAGACQRTTSLIRHGSVRGPAPCRPGATRGEHLSKTLLRSLRFTAPVLFILGALNAVTAQVQDDRGALATAPCLCVCAGGLFVEDRFQHGLCHDRRVLAYVAARQRTSPMDAARDLEFSSRTIEVSLERPVAEGLVAHGGEEAAVRTYSLSG